MQTMHVRWFLALVLLGALIAACGNGDDDDTTETTTASTSTTTATVESAASPAAPGTPSASPAATPSPVASPGVATPTMSGTPAAGIEIPDTPVGGQLAWLLETLNSGATDLTPELVEERFTPEFLAQVPPDQLIELLQEIAAAGPFELQSLQEPMSPTSVAANLAPQVGDPLLVSLVVEEAEPYPMSGLLFQPALAPVALASWEDFDSQLAGLAASGSFLAAEVVEGELVPVHSLNPESRLAIGSGFKLYILGELARQIEAGEIGWDDELTVRDELKSLPSGVLQDEPAGTAVTFQHVAGLMISISDNTATDHLMHELGRENIEAIQSDMGHGQPDVNIPMLTTREFFALKLVVPQDRIDAYLAGTDEEQRQMLETEIGTADLSGVDGSVWTSPRSIDQVEWFASPEDLSQALVWLDEAATRRGLEPVREILSINPGVPVDPDVWAWVGFKGGSEPGVLNMNWLLERADGRTFVISVNLNDQSQLIDETATANLLLGAMNLVAEAE